MPTNKAPKSLRALLALIAAFVVVICGGATSFAAPVTNDNDIVLVTPGTGIQVDLNASALVDTETKVTVSDDGVTANASVNTDSTVVLKVGGTWNPGSELTDALTAAFPDASAPEDLTVLVPYIAKGFDFDGVDYNQSRKSGEAAVRAAIEAAVNDGKTVKQKAFSQGADAVIGGTCDAIQNGVNPASIENITAVASPVQPHGGLRNRLPIDVPGIDRGDGGNTCGAPVDFICVGGDIVCRAPSDGSLVKWVNNGLGYWFVHSNKGGSCTYEVLACDHQVYVRTEGNLTFTQIVTEAEIVQLFDKAGIALPEFAKNVVRDIVADGRPAYRPSVPESAPEPAPAAMPIKMVIPLSESLAPEPAPIIIPDFATVAHNTVDSLGLDPNTTAALNNVVGGIFAR